MHNPVIDWVAYTLKRPTWCQLVVLLCVKCHWVWGAWLCCGASHTVIVYHLCAAVLSQTGRAHAVEWLDCRGLVCACTPLQGSWQWTQRECGANWFVICGTLWQIRWLVCRTWRTCFTTAWPCNRVGWWGSSASQVMVIPAESARNCQSVKVGIVNVGKGLDSSQCEPIWSTAVVCLQEKQQTVDVHWLLSTKPPNQIGCLPYTLYCWLAWPFGSCSLFFIDGLGDCISPNLH